MSGETYAIIPIGVVTLAMSPELTTESSFGADYLGNLLLVG